MESYLLAIVITILIIFIFVSFACERLSRIPLQEYNKYPAVFSSKIPKVIYSYWNSETPPPTVQKCIASWKRHNPDHEVMVLNEETAKQYVDMSSWTHAKTQQQKADMVRISLLKQRGGIWLDSTVYLNRSLGWVHSYQVHENSEYVGYHISSLDTNPNRTVPVVENWFMAAVPQSRFMSDWHDRFMSMNTYPTVKDYVKDLMKDVDSEISEKVFCYLSMHLAAIHVLTKNKYQLSLLHAENSPFVHNHALDWLVVFFPITMLMSKRSFPVIKWRGGERFIAELIGFHKYIE